MRVRTSSSCARRARTTASPCKPAPTGPVSAATSTTSASGSPIPAELEAAIAEVTAAGGSLIERGEHAPGRPYAYVADPDGHVIEL